MEVQKRLQKVLAGRYRLGRELGRGGFATVFQAEDLKHGRQVAIKVLHPEAVAAIGNERFLREIGIAASLSHPHIVPLFDSGAVDSLHYYVMPLLEGESLRERIERDRQMPLEDALRLTGEIASALGHAHQRGLVHRDVKPENVLLSGGLALVADFGIAREPAGGGGDSRTAVGTVMGTAAYMSPEQAAGSADVDQRSDVYALACVLYEMLAGQPPFTGPVQSVIHQQLTATPRPITDLRPGVPRRVAEAIARALAKSKADRFPTVAAFVQALNETDGRAPASKSVAVLPFVNLSTDPENEYFTDGITEDVIAQLAKVGALKVISRTSVMPFKDHRGNLREIGARLGVSTLLEGSVRRVGDRVRIVAQLIDAESDQHLWAETYDRKLTDIFEIQSDVALHIATALDAQLAAKERALIGKEPTRDVLAYELYLQGRHFMIRYTADGLRTAIGYFERAIERDPDYALAYAGVALAHTELGETGALERDQVRPAALAAATKALELDPDLGDAHSVMAFARMVFEFDWAGAEAEFRRALELTPNSADAHDLYGRLCAAQERYEEAIPLHRRSQELDPLAHRSDLATTLIKAGRLDEAIEAAGRATRLDPRDPRGHATLGWALLKAGREAEGIAAIEHAVSLAPGHGMWLAQLGQAYAMTGRTREARRILEELTDPARPTRVSPYYLAFVYVGLGELDGAMNCLELAFEMRAATMYGIRGSFLLAPLRTHPRFVALLRKMNLA